MKNNLNSQKNGYKHLSAEEREIIALGLASGKTIKEIAREINRHPSTVSREIYRNGPCTSNEYLGFRAHERSERRKALSHVKERLKSPIVREYVEKKLILGWAPEAIAGRIGIDILGAKTNYESIYLYIYKEKPDWVKYLPRSHKKRWKRSGKKRKRRTMIPNRTSIEDRPNFINERRYLGDWEADLIVSRESSNVLMVLRERKSQLTLIRNLKDKKASTARDALIDMLKGFPQEMRRSITFDNGTENALHQEVAKRLKLITYFCNPYSSWEKGSVENTNGLIRRYLPKKTNFSLISKREIKKIQDALNNRPRKSLRFLTPYEFQADCT